jgi:hypothetical protein
VSDLPRSGRPRQLGPVGSVALATVGIGSQVFFAFTGRWFLFGASVALGAGMPLLGLIAPQRWASAMGDLTGEKFDAARMNRRAARVATLTFSVAGAVILVAALLLR